MEIDINSLTELDNAAQQILEANKSARIFAFYGEMGAGKTTLIKVICNLLNIHQTVNSPTFSLVNEYYTDEGDVIYHFDFYRIKNLNEAFDIGYESYFYSGNYCFIEWPEKIESLLPDDHIPVRIEITGNGRRISFP